MVVSLKWGYQIIQVMDDHAGSWDPPIEETLKTELRALGVQPGRRTAEDTLIGS